MAQYEVTLVAIDIRKWDLESQRLSLTTYFVMDDEEKTHMFELSIIQPPEMVEEFLGKIRVGCEQKMRNGGVTDEQINITLPNETYLRQKLYNYFKRILLELNNPKRKKGQSKMIFTTHMDVYNENQDVSFLPQIIQFFVVLNWARKYYEKEDYQRAVEPLRKLVKIKPDFGLGYKWLARSLKKIRKYEDATRFYEKYAEVDNSTDAWLDLAKSYRKGKIFDKSEQIYQDIMKEEPENKEARIGMAQIKFARNEPDFLNILDDLYKEDPDWLKKWLGEEFNFRIYASPKTPLTPIQASSYLGYDKVFELTQHAFRNEVPSHFNPSRARMSFYKEELDNWALVMNRFSVGSEEIVLHPENISLETVKPIEVNVNEDDGEGEESEKELKEPTRPVKRSTKVEEILRKIRESRAEAQARAARAAGGEQAPAAAADRETAQETTERETVEEKAKPVKRRGRPPKKQTEATRTSKPAEEPERAEKPKRRRGRPPKKKTAESDEQSDNTNENPPGE
ncbi:MAG: hypothetical protein P8184_16620, partial [Calditrichia bacterium]